MVNENVAPFYALMLIGLVGIIISSILLIYIVRKLLKELKKRNDDQSNNP